MSALRLLWYYLWIAPHILQGIIVFVMVRRRLHRQFPMFFLYMVFEILQFGILFAISQSGAQFGGSYARVYAVGLAVSTAIRFGVIYALFCHFFHRYPALSGPGKLMFRGLTVVLLLLAVGLAFSAPGKGANFLFDATYVMDRTVSVLQCGLLISLFFLSRYFVLLWRSQAFGIALGLGIFACVELAAAAVRLHVGSFGSTAANILIMATYHCCVLVWLFYLMASERQPRYPSTASAKLPAYDLEIWNQELQRLLQQ